MSQVRGFVTAVVRRVKQDHSYTLSPELPTHAVLRELADRSFSAARSFWTLRRVPGGRVRFVERGVVIQHRSHLTVGSGSVIERGVLIRALSRDGFHLGRNVTIGRYSVLEGTSVLWQMADGLEIGDGSAIGDWSFLGCAGGVRIGRNVIIGQRLSVHSENHNFDDASRAIKDQGVSHKGIVIEDDCWIGANVTVLDGVVVGHGSVVAAGAVVTKSVPPNSVVGGNPARLIKERA